MKVTNPQPRSTSNLLWLISSSCLPKASGQAGASIRKNLEVLGYER